MYKCEVITINIVFLSDFRAVLLRTLTRDGFALETHRDRKWKNKLQSWKIETKIHRLNHLIDNVPMNVLDIELHINFPSALIYESMLWIVI